MREIGIITPPKLATKYSTRIKYVIPDTINRDYLKYLNDTRKDSVIYLDCRQTNWKRIPSDLDLTIQVIEELSPNYIITPSYMFDTKKTVGVFETFLNKLDELELTYRKGLLVGCLEGTNSKEVDNCLNSLEKYGLKKFIIPNSTLPVCKQYVIIIVYLKKEVDFDEQMERYS